MHAKSLNEVPGQVCRGNVIRYFGKAMPVAPDPDAANQAHGNKIFYSMPGSFQGYGCVYV